MSMMIHRNKKKKVENRSVLAQSEKNSESYVEENSEKQQYTRTDINRMNKDDLISLANKAGIKRVEEYNGTDLRKELIEKLSL